MNKVSVMKREELSQMNAAGKKTNKNLHYRNSQRYFRVKLEANTNMEKRITIHQVV